MNANPSSWTWLPAPWRRDIVASLVVFLVALPLSMGIALACGVPILAGIVGAAVGGVVAGALGGSPFLVSGPTASLAVIMAGITAEHGIVGVAAATVTAGLIQVGLGTLRAARLATLVSPAVMHGMLAGTGVLIAAAQLHVMLGGASHGSVWENILALGPALMHVDVPTLGLSLLALALLWLWPKTRLARGGPPASLVAVLGTTLVSTVGGWEVAHVTLPATLRHLAWVQLHRGDIVTIAGTATAVALIASSESLMSAMALDRITGTHSRLNRELVAQGAANIVSGFFGGLPVAGVVVRSTTNVSAGAVGRRSTMFHGIWMVLAVGLFGTVLEHVPLAALAAVLTFVGLKVIESKHIRVLRDNGEIVIYIVTFFGVIAVNLLVGIALGMLTATVRLFITLTRASVRVQPDGGTTVVVIQGVATFLLMPKLSAVLAHLPPKSKIRLELSTPLVDHAAQDMLEH